MAAKRNFLSRSLTREIGDRDGWICHLCLRWIDRNLGDRHPRSASLDHITPVSKGGTDNRNNLRIACHQCNALRNNRSIAECVGTPELRELFVKQVDLNIERLGLKQQAKAIAEETATQTGGRYQRGRDYDPYCPLTGKLRPERSRVAITIAMPPFDEQPYNSKTGARRAGIEWPVGSGNYGT